MLDACRYDVFSEFDPFSGDLEPIISPSSTSRTLFKQNITGKSFLDTVYVTATPFFPLAQQSFFELETTFAGEEQVDSDGVVSKTKTAEGVSLPCFAAD